MVDKRNTGELVVFKSLPAMWRREYDGCKPNTVRFLAHNDDRLGVLLRASENGEPVTVGIVNTEDGRVFFRSLTDITFGGTVLGMLLVVLSWRHEDGTGTYRDPDEGATCNPDPSNPPRGRRG